MEEQYKPLSPWAYFGYSILFNIPIVGLVCLIIFAFNDSNINRKNWARSYFIMYLLLVVFVIVILIAGVSIPSVGEAINAMNTAGN